MQVALNTQHDEALERLISRVQSISYDHKQKLNKHFHIWCTSPDNEKEAEKWFKEGYFHHDDCCLSWGPKPDHEGYEAASIKLWAAKDDTLDIIYVQTDPDMRLKALKDFESATFH